MRSNLHHSCSKREPVLSQKALRSQAQITQPISPCLENFDSQTTLSLSKRKANKNNAMKNRSKCGRGGLKEWLICGSALPVPGTFLSAPTVAAFPIRSWAKFPESLPSNRNQSIVFGFLLEVFRFNNFLGPRNRIRSLS